MTQETRGLLEELQVGWSPGSLHYDAAILRAICQRLGESPEGILKQLESGSSIAIQAESSKPFHTHEVHVNGVNDLASLQRKAAYFDQITAVCDPALGRAIRELGGQQLLRMTPKELREYMESGSLPKPQPNTQDVIDAYLTHMEDTGAAEGYLKVRARKLRFFARQYPSLPTDPEAIRAYLRQFKTRDVPTRQDQWKALSALYKFASDAYGVPNQMLKVDKPRFKKKSGQRLSRDQARTFLSVVETDLEWALVTCYFGLRFRRVEAERLWFKDIKSDYIVVQGKERIEELPLLPIFRDKILKLQNNHSSNDPVFGLKADTLAYHIERIFRRAGIEGVRASPHTLRNTAGALWSTFGGDWTANRQLLRHGEKTMTDHYSPLTIDELRAKDERHNPMLNLMRELGLVPGEPEPIYQNTTGVLVTEADPARLLPELLDQMVTLGQRAQRLSQALGGNGHRPEELKEIIEYLKCQAGR